jgi:cellobiose phosphorylase
MNDYRDFGDFSADGQEFVITKMDTPRPWLNYSWNDRIISSIDQRGRGTSWCRDQSGRRTRLLKDRRVYLTEGTQTWTAGWDNDSALAPQYRCRHCLGSSVLESRFQDIETSWRIVTDRQAPVEHWRVTVTNRSARARRLTVVPFIEFDLDGDYYGTQENYCRTISEPGLITAQISYYERHDQLKSGFAACSGKPRAFETSRRRFAGGFYSSLSRPHAVSADTMTNGEASDELLIAAFAHEMDLAPNASFSFSMVMGPCHGTADAKTTRAAHQDPHSADKAAAAFAQRAKESFSAVDLRLPDEYLNTFFNIWTKQQLFLNKDYARLGFMGFRDTMQDAQAVCPYDQAAARQALLTAARHQFKDGSAMRGWIPDDNNRYADSGVWLAFTLAEYLKETNDFALLPENTPYLDGGQDTLWAHAVKALRWIYADPGPHGLTKVFFGDWNDSLGIGVRGIGESVWLSLAAVWACKHLVEIARIIKDTDVEREFAAMQTRLTENLEAHAWDGAWYLCGYTDDGEPVGSAQCDEGKIYCNSQSWAILAGLAPQRWDLLEKSMNKHLLTDYGYLVHAPAYTSYRPSHGRITCLPPGWGENASSYCHVSAFKAVADCVRRDGDAALATLRSVMPDNPQLPVKISGLEPYTFSNMFCGPQHTRPGATFKGWTTGTVPWALRCVTHFLLGVRPHYSGLMIDPVLPKTWAQASMRRVFRQAEYSISVNNQSQGKSGMESKPVITVDGQRLDGNIVPYEHYQGKHKVEVVLY